MIRGSSCLELTMSSIAIVISLFVCNAVNAQSPADTEDKWSKTNAEREDRIAIADREQYEVGRIYIFGSTYTRFREFRKRMAPSFNEGYVFSRRSLKESIRRISKMKTIYPISMDDVQVMLDEKNRVVHFGINVNQKPNRHHE